MTIIYLKQDKNVIELQHKYKDAVSYKETTTELWKNFINKVIDELHDKNNIMPYYYQNRLGKTDARTVYKIKEDEETIWYACLCSLSDKRGLKDGRTKFYIGRYYKNSDLLIEILDNNDQLVNLFELANDKKMDKCVEKAVDWLQNKIVQYS